MHRTPHIVQRHQLVHPADVDTVDTLAGVGFVAAVLAVLAVLLPGFCPVSTEPSACLYISVGHEPHGVSACDVVSLAQHEPRLLAKPDWPGHCQISIAACSHDLTIQVPRCPPTTRFSNTDVTLSSMSLGLLSSWHDLGCIQSVHPFDHYVCDRQHCVSPAPCICDRTEGLRGALDGVVGSKRLLKQTGVVRFVDRPGNLTAAAQKARPSSR